MHIQWDILYTDKWELSWCQLQRSWHHENSDFSGSSGSKVQVKNALLLCLIKWTPSNQRNSTPGNQTICLFLSGISVFVESVSLEDRAASLHNSWLCFTMALYISHCFWWKCCFYNLNIGGLVQERGNSSALAMELCLSCTNPLIWSGLKL